MSRSAAGFIAAFFALAPLAHAYVPPSFFIVKALAKKHASMDELRARHKVTFYKKNGEMIRTFNETLVMTDPEHVQVRLTDEAGNEVMTRSRKLVGGKSGDLDRPVTYDLVLLKDAASMFEHFKALGLPLRTEADLYAEKEGNLPYKPETNVGFIRYDNNRIAIMVGEGTPKAEAQPKSTMLWVEKDSLLPIRAVFPSAPESGMSSEPLDIRFSGYQPHKNIMYPRVMTVARNGNPWVKIDTIEVKPGASGSLEEAKTKAELDGDTRELVETYFKWVR